MKYLFYFICFLLNLSVYSGNARILEELATKGQLFRFLRCKKVGYYVGSFDPLHRAHEAIVQESLRQKLCDYVLIYPNWGGDTYKNRTNIQIRLEMLFSNFINHPRILLTRLPPKNLQDLLMHEANRDHIAGYFPVKSAIYGTQYLGILGSDVALETLKHTEQMSIFLRGVKLSPLYYEHTIGGLIALPAESFIINYRKGHSPQELNGMFGDRPFHVINAPFSDVSATRIRSLVKEGRSIDELVNSSVQKIIERYHLYRS